MFLNPIELPGMVRVYILKYMAQKHQKKKKKKQQQQLLFGIFAIHTPESCPLNNKQSREIFMQIDEKLKIITAKYNISKIVGFYMSVLEHQWVIIVEAENAHDIETLCIEAGISAFNTVKIVPLNNFDVVMKRIKGIV